jgi:hypothetical protein
MFLSILLGASATIILFESGYIGYKLLVR